MEMFSPEGAVIRIAMDSEYGVIVVDAKTISSPQLSAWYGGKRMMATRPDIVQQLFVTKEEYDEHGGPRICGRKFGQIYAMGL